MDSQAADWSGLHRELDSWGGAGRTATFWWRDDDARAVTPELEKLLDLADASKVPLALSVVPVSADEGLAGQLRGHESVAVFQHGYSHQNQAAPGDQKTEFGRTRPFPVALGEMATGWQRLDSLFGRQAKPVMVPPWNRLEPALVPMLPEIGYTGLSTWKPRRTGTPVSGLAQVNTHVDIIEWRGTRRFIGEGAALGGLVRHLEGRRTGKFDADEPTGVLTHHLAHDGACWAFAARLFAETLAHRAAEWLGADDLFALPAEAAA